MRKYSLITLIYLVAVNISLLAQDQDDVEITRAGVDVDDAAAHIWFLASDELKGRNTGSPEIDIAAAYIAAQYRKYGVRSFDETGTYLQAFRLQSSKPPVQGEFKSGSYTFDLGQNLLAMEAADLNTEASVYFSHYAMPEEIESKDVKGKIVICKAGKSGENNPRSYFNLSRQKRKAAKENGAVALVELYNSPAMPWSTLLNYLNREQLSLSQDSDDAEDSDFGAVWLDDPGDTFYTYISQSKKIDARLTLSSRETSTIIANNVIGFIEGSDPQLRNEYILLSAHYDHVGFETGTNGEDSIYNGARDNAIGVAAILAAAGSFGKTPSKRSVIFLACTAEEKGLLGSRWFADHPPVPLKQIVFNLNIDGGGYNDITKVSVVGLDRTTAGEHLKSAASAFGLGTIADPAPEQNLFDRSDNVSFASKGIPAPTFTTGFTSFDEEIIKYYHQVTDEAESLDFDYLSRYFLAYALAARRVANMSEAPFWITNDKYEEAGIKLYGKDH